LSETSRVMTVVCSCRSRRPCRAERFCCASRHDRESFRSGQGRSKKDRRRLDLRRRHDGSREGISPFDRFDIPGCRVSEIPFTATFSRPNTAELTFLAHVGLLVGTVFPGFVGWAPPTTEPNRNQGWRFVGGSHPTILTFLINTPRVLSHFQIDGRARQSQRTGTRQRAARDPARGPVSKVTSTV
jgi:hypothetical protein